MTNDHKLPHAVQMYKLKFVCNSVEKN